MSTVSLQLIVKDEAADIQRIVSQAIDYVDQINITISDKPTFNKVSKIIKGVPALEEKLNVKYREWNDNFADARNANYALATTDWTFWIDADDEFDFTRLPEIVAAAENDDAESVFLPYNYAFNDQGEIITRHWRERLIRSGKGYSWRGAVHETLISDDPGNQIQIDQPVNHRSKNHAASLERNHAILVNAVKVDSPDPRDLCYLGASYFSLGEYDKCIETLLDYLEVGGSVEDAYRSMTLISEAAYHLGRHDHALEYASKCMVMKPEYPMGYWLMAQYEADQSNWPEALEWVKVSLTKPDPQTLSVFDPSARDRAILIGAQAEFMLENYNAALAYLRLIPNNESAKELYKDFQKEADAETFVKMLPNLRKYFNNDRSLFESLTDDIKYDKRVRPLRNVATEPKKWPARSIVIFCGQGYEEWGPHTLDKGMGGSEEAVVYLSKELSRLGYDVTVFAEHNSHYQTIVDWRPWNQVDFRDDFDIFVAWRTPSILEKVNARIKLADIHDVLPKELVKDYPDVTYLFKSQYHKNLYGPVNSKVIGNGVKVSQFHEDL